MLPLPLAKTPEVSLDVLLFSTAIQSLGNPNNRLSQRQALAIPSSSPHMKLAFKFNQFATFSKKCSHLIRFYLHLSFIWTIQLQFQVQIQVFSPIKIVISLPSTIGSVSRFGKATYQLNLYGQLSSLLILLQSQSHSPFFTILFLRFSYQVRAEGECCVIT
ncbi:hypothetical protein K402DRAFT_192509 [Aulographum hederae CBS 113979]|uniref:Uncharacterized protein n=1 Tax=Aulographum hederae CBS 113979 TaxID=1176131 RepID=A0A6G1GNV1_9PEZI|nr:hypothetical protein K402DRAFT_192509 [Aulographum hederae CBS 113979]